MKKLLLSLAIVLFITNINFAQNKQTEESLDMTFETTSHDFGTIKYGSDKGVHDFSFKNTSAKPIVLTNVSSSCGCTVPQWDKKPVQPGETSTIKVKYNTKLGGKFSKSITVYSTAANSPIKLNITGNVTISLADMETIKAENKLSRELTGDKKAAIEKKKSMQVETFEEGGNVVKSTTGSTKKRTFKRVSTVNKEEVLKKKKIKK